MGSGADRRGRYGEALLIWSTPFVRPLRVTVAALPAPTHVVLAYLSVGSATQARRTPWPKGTSLYRSRPAPARDRLHRPALDAHPLTPEGAAITATAAQGTRQPGGHPLATT
jgi:hypothetical protein